MKKTNEHEMFFLREDNRPINRGHVGNLVESIRRRNMLDMCPIIVNEKLEVIDGQHRLEAAKILGVDIYYEVRADVKKDDMIVLNISKGWSARDFLNYYVTNKYTEYLKLKRACDRLNISPDAALKVFSRTQGKQATRDFRLGTFKYDNSLSEEIEADIIRTRDILKKYHGNTIFALSGKFFVALVYVMQEENFVKKKWFQNLEKMVNKTGARITMKDYYKMFVNIHNWRNPKPIVEGDYE